MHFLYSLRIAAFAGTVCCICCGIPTCLGGDHSADGAQVEIWLGNERVQRPRLNRVLPPRATNFNVDPTDSLGYALEAKQKPDDRGKLQATNLIETAEAEAVERQADTPAAFSPRQSSIQPLEPPERPRPAVHADQLGQARVLLMQAIELTRRADIILSETGIPYTDPRSELDAPSPPASPMRQLETTKDPKKLPADPLGKTSSREHRMSGEQASPPRSDASDSSTLATTPAMVRGIGTTAPIPSNPPNPSTPSISGLTRPAGHAIPALVVRSLEAGEPGEKSAPRATGSQVPCQHAVARAQQATLVALPRLGAGAIGVLVGLLLAVLAVLEFGGRLRSRIGVYIVGSWQRLARRCVVPSVRRERLSPVESAGIEQTLLAAVVAHNLRLRGQLACPLTFAAGNRS